MRRRRHPARAAGAGALGSGGSAGWAADYTFTVACDAIGAEIVEADLQYAR
ncbi:hypothetical protein K1T35_19320 [Pseudonocardia sp. DSM 110487]|uniref:hypothetical protein n=1 Tax=Pseudonocardia sp. DSM 110487 TaxID=2865833 RepID=UPI001C699C37|nr:hypothetical protein [Pseudonocardia sp. DSM 110487]QYN39154.1 hypothetical protein K1T35_19320 [Pseudonocardia sp. DSM 110487]